MKRKIWGTFLLTITLFILGLYVIAPHLIRKKLSAYVNENCVTCVLEMGTIRTDILFSNVTFEDIHFYWGDPKVTAIDFRIPVLKMHVVLKDLFKHVIHFQNIVIERPKVEVLEGDLSSKVSESKTDSTQFQIDGIEISQAHFTYTREHNGRLAPILLNQIDGQIDQVANTPDRIDSLTTAKIKAILESSGKVNLKITSHLMAKALNVEVDLVLNQLLLDQMNPYFETNDGVQLTGKLIEGHSGVSIQQQQLHAYVQAQYENLHIQFKKTPKRTVLSAFFSNLIEKLKLNTKNTDVRQSQQIQYIDIAREHDETILSFIFRGMKEAALKVATHQK